MSGVLYIVFLHKFKNIQIFQIDYLHIELIILHKFLYLEGMEVNLSMFFYHLKRRRHPRRNLKGGGVVGGKNNDLNIEIELRNG